MIKMNLIVLSIAIFLSIVHGLPVGDEKNDDKTTTEATNDYSSSLPICKRNDPDLNECIKNATVTLKDKLSQGIPELNLRSIDPLMVPTVKLEQMTQKLDYKAVLMDVTLRGLSNYEFTDVETDIENLTIYAKIDFSHVYMDAEYMLMGTFEKLPVQMSGKLMANFTDTSIGVIMQGGLIKKNDKFHFMTQGTEVSVAVGKSSAKFENVYSGNEEMSHIAEHMITMHSEEVLEELRPGVETVVGMLIDDVANKFFKNLPFDKLFPE